MVEIPPDWLFDLMFIDGWDCWGIHSTLLDVHTWCQGWWLA